GFVLRNLADLPHGILEQVRVLRPGGRLVVLETTPGPRGSLRTLFTAYFRYLVPLFGALIAGDAAAYTYLPQSTAAFVEPEQLQELVRAAGLVDVSSRPLGFGSIAVMVGRKPSMLPDSGGAA